MDSQNLLYAIVQLGHNFGAVAATGGAVAGWMLHRREATMVVPLVRLVLAGWLLQAASGAAFGLTSFAYYGQLPDIHGVAVVALVIKLVCAATALILSTLLLRIGPAWPPARTRRAWIALAMLAATALSAAAFLRWFS